MSTRVTIIAIACLFLIAGVIGFLVFKQLNEKEASLGTQQPANNGVEPFGPISGNVVNKPPTSETSTSTSFGDTSGRQAQLIKVVDAPTANGSFVEESNGANVYFVDRATGNTYKFNILGQFLGRMTNTTVPRIYRSVWAKDGKTVILQTLNSKNEVTTLSSRLAPQKTSTTTKIAALELQNTILPKNISNILISPATAKIFYTVPTDEGSDGFIANIDGSKASRIFSSPLSELTATWPVDSTIILTTKPASTVTGFSYSLNTKSGSLSPLISNILGLTTLGNTTMEKVAYSDESNRLQIYNVKTGESQLVAVSTVANKCVWSKRNKNILYCAVPTAIPAGDYPEMWYQGLVSFNDNIYQIDTATNKTEIIAQPLNEYKQSIDATDLSLSANEDYLLFTNKKDYTIWTLNLSR
ncbi:MAG: seg [Candidatus Paceibacter sp.]|jgi:hypothetical protein|nr:seg [Candidatus Paceibacter sp.]